MASLTPIFSLNTKKPFPLEVLEIILAQSYDVKSRRYILESCDLDCLSKQSEQLRMILPRYKTAYLFEKILVMVFPALDRDDVYKCRLVCKRWTTAIDDYLENPPFCRPYNNHDPDLVLRGKFTSDTYMRYPIELMFEKTLRHFEDLNVCDSLNPFIGRSIVINPEITNFGWENDFIEKCSPKLDRLCKVLERFGKFVYHLEWVVLGPCMHGAKFYAILCRLLSHLPNLKTLRVRFWIKPYPNKKSLFQVCENCKIPHIESLYLVDLNILDLPNYIEEKIITSFGAGVKKLCLPISLNLVSVIHHGLKNLNELSLWSIYDSSLLCKLINKIVQIQLPVKKLKLELGKQFDITEILNYFAASSIEYINFGKSDLLDDLFIEDNKSCINRCLHTLQIRDSFELEYKFLRNLPNMAYLILSKNYVVGKWFVKIFEEKKMSSNDENEISNNIRLCIYCGISPSKAFWDKFPKLKYILVDSDVDDHSVSRNVTDRQVMRYVRWS